MQHRGSREEPRRPWHCTWLPFPWSKDTSAWWPLAGSPELSILIQEPESLVWTLRCRRKEKWTVQLVQSVAKSVAFGVRLLLPECPEEESCHFLDVYHVLNNVLHYLLWYARPPCGVGGTSNSETEQLRLTKVVRNVVKEKSQDLVPDLSDPKLTFFCSSCLLLGRGCNSPAFIAFSVPTAWMNFQ